MSNTPGRALAPNTLNLAPVTPNNTLSPPVHQCPVCPETFTQAIALSKHQYKNHKTIGSYIVGGSTYTPIRAIDGSVICTVPSCNMRSLKGTSNFITHVRGVHHFDLVSSPAPAANPAGDQYHTDSRSPLASHTNRHASPLQFGQIPPAAAQIILTPTVANLSDEIFASLGSDHLGGPPLLNGPTPPPPEVNPVTGLSTLLDPSRQTQVIYNEAHFPMEHTNEAFTTPVRQHDANDHEQDPNLRKRPLIGPEDEGRERRNVHPTPTKDPKKRRRSIPATATSAVPPPSINLPRPNTITSATPPGDSFMPSAYNTDDDPFDDMPGLQSISDSTDADDDDDDWDDEDDNITKPSATAPSSIPAEHQVSTTPALQPFGFVIFQPLKVLICLICHAACTGPKSALEHAKAGHGHRTSFSAEKVADFKAECSRLDIVSDAHQCLIPGPRQAPVPFINVKENGYACGMCSGVSTSRTAMLRHIRRHGVPNPSEHIRTGVSYQTIFQKPLRYFEVIPELTSASPTDPLPILLSTILPNIPPIALLPANTELEIPPMLKNFRWHIIMEKARESREQRKIVQSIKAPPKADDVVFSTIPKATLALLDLGAEIALAHPQSFRIRKHLMQGPELKNSFQREDGKKPFWQPLPKGQSTETYANIISTFVQMALKIMQGIPGFVIHIAFTEHQRSKGNALLQEASRGQCDDATIQALHHFLYSLYEAQPPNDNPLNAPWNQLLALRALHDSGSFMTAEITTGILAKMKYLANILVVVQADSVVAEGDRDGEGMINAIIDGYRSVLSLSANNIFSMLCDQQSYASSLVFRTPQHCRLLWDDLFQRVSIDGETVDIDELRRALQVLEQETEASIQDLLGIVSLNDHLPSTLTDHHDILAQDYSFLDHIPSQLNRVFGLIDSARRAKGLPPFAFVDGNGEFMWNHPVLRSILIQTGKINTNMSILHYVEDTISTRVTEHLETPLRNGMGRPRGLYGYGSELIIVKRYSKRTNANGVDLSQPLIPTKKVSDLSLAFYTLVRPFEEVLAFVLHAEKGRAEYRGWMYCANGHRITPDEFRVHFSKFMARFCGVSLPPGSYRHIACAIARQYIRTRLIVGEDSPIDLAQSHTTGTARTYYGLDSSQIGTDVFIDIKSVCQEWHRVLGLTDKPPPPPLRLAEEERAQNALTKITIKPLLASLATKADCQEILAALVAHIRQTESVIEEMRSEMRVTRRLLIDSLSPPTPRPSGNPVADLSGSEDMSFWEAPSESDTLILAPDSEEIPMPVDQPMGTSSDMSSIQDPDYSDVFQDHMFIDDAATVEPNSSTPSGEAESTQTEYVPSELSSSAEPSTPCPGPRRPIKRNVIQSSTPIPRHRRSARTMLIESSSAPSSPPPQLQLLPRPPSAPPAVSNNFNNEIIVISSDPPTVRSSSSPIVPSTSHPYDPEESPIQSSFSDSSDHYYLDSAIAVRARRGLQLALGDDHAVETCPEQLMAIMEGIKYTCDFVAVLGTGMGKTAIYLALALLFPGEASLVITPFRQLLQEQIKIARSKGIKCAVYTSGCELPHDVQLIFLQPESNCNLRVFKQLLLTPVGRRITRFLVDEVHDWLIHHPDRASVWSRVSLTTRSCSLQRIFLTATLPPSLEATFIEATGSAQDLKFIRRSTNRPELSYHSILATSCSPHQPIESCEAWQILLRLSNNLHRWVLAESKDRSLPDRILLIFRSVPEVKAFKRAFPTCAIHYSELPSVEQATNLAIWGTGSHTIMACTTSLAQGIHRDNVRFLAFYGDPYNALACAQGAGRAGRDGQPAFVISILQPQPSSAVDPNNDPGQSRLLSQALRKFDVCRRYTLTKLVDGPKLAVSCMEDPDCNDCDYCDRDADMATRIRSWIVDPKPASTSSTPLIQPPRIVEPLLPPFVVSSASKFTAKPASKPLVSLPIPPQPQRRTPLAPAHPVATVTPHGTLPNVSAETAKRQQLMPQGATPHVSGDEIPPESSNKGKAKMTSAQVEAQSAMRNAFTSLSQPSAIPPFIKAPYTRPPSMSQPASSSSSSSRVTFQQRGQAHDAAHQSRVSKAAQFDNLMLKLRDNTCGACLVIDGQIRHHTNMSLCPPTEIPRWFLPFKQKFRYEPYHYCRYCGFPQERSHNSEGPTCHRWFNYAGKRPCEWADLPYAVVWAIWHIPERRELMLRHFGHPQDLTFDAFEQWVVRVEADRGEFTKLLEVFLWFFDLGEIEWEA